MEQLVLKTEVQSNGEILLFYVDENGDNEEGVVTTVENIEHQALQLEQGNYVIEDEGEITQLSIPQSSSISDVWTDENIRQLLIFYTDNKHTFISGTTKRQHLWTVACRTMLIGKTPDLCELKLDFLRQKYLEIIAKVHSGVYIEWEYFQLCHQAFGDDITEETYVGDDYKTEIHIATDQEIILDGNKLITVNKNQSQNQKKDDKVKLMLNLYLKYKKEFEQAHWTKNLWEIIAAELGDDDGEYWQKRFLNYKQHYLRLLEKVQTNTTDSVNWPYFELFNQIFEGNENFSRKYLKIDTVLEENIIYDVNDWNSTEVTVLVKYCFDCFDEFQDYSIPDKFLWGEIGRLLDKDADDCKAKYEELKDAHFDKYYKGGYEIKVRKPIEILFDSIVAKEVELQFSQAHTSKDTWSQEDLDSMVQFIYENAELYKDSSCHFVCWAAVAKKNNKNLLSCRLRWEELVNEYKSILESKKEYPDLHIQWRFIDLFDRIFDFGMDTKLLAGFETNKQVNQSGGKIGVKKVKIKTEDTIEENSEDDDEYIDERGIRRRNKRRPGESKAIKILEYYLKNKDKFSTTNRNKHSLWEILAKQIGISATQCAHRFRNLKQVYTAYVRREINKPDMPILWPYYALCKKVFGYRAIKNKLKNGMIDSDESEEWTAKEIKMLINYFSSNFSLISNNDEDVSIWMDLGKEIGKSETVCREKFLELRKSYRKLKTMRIKNPNVKIMWKYFNMFETIYKSKDGSGHESMDIDDGELYMEIPGSDDAKLDEEDYQCIIVMPEGEDISQIENSQIIMQNEVDNIKTLFNNTETNKKWTKKIKKKLIINYINYIRSNRGKDINSKEMWSHIGSKLNKTPVACKRMFIKMKTSHKQIDASDLNVKTPYYTLMEKVMRLKPKYSKTEGNTTLNSSKTYKDVNLPDDKVENALKYYLENLENFLSPKYEKKYLWTELANTISEPVTKIFNKINFLKQNFNPDIFGNFSELLKEIIEKEVIIKQGMLTQSVPIIDELEEAFWSDNETEQLLQWYLSNLDKFKNPKFVRSYLWLEVSGLLNKSAISCSKKMSEIRSQYRNMVRTTDEELKDWRFLDLCLKIYGTGKKNE